ncbi:MAG: transglutaminase-like domain-containing protein, partial [Candidatus Poseidoniia archaeon]|nr:transglutaminase-like domain-containing protein [Candidatus Poseidoniia archaeon]
MKLCDFCGFVIKEQEAQCSNCRMIVPGRESLVAPPKAVSLEKPPVSSVPVNSISSYIPKKFIALLLVAGLFASPQAQILLTDGMDYWDEMNTPYYTMPETITLTYVRNFEIFIEEGNEVEYSLTLSLPSNRPSGSQTDTMEWQVIDNVNVSPSYNLTQEGRMEWRNNLSGSDRDYISLEYTATINLIRPDLKIADSGLVSDIPEDFDIYLEDEWLIEPSNSEIQILAIELSNGTNGNVMQILKNIFDYIESNYQYQKSSVPKSCPDIIVGRVGDCDDFSILFSSIARAAGIPAWLELGIIPAFIDTSQGCDLRDWGGHAWVNAVVPLSDGTITVVNIDLANSYFMWLPPYRISDWVDNGNGDDLDSYYYLFSSKGINSQATYKENSYVSDCEIQGEIKLT